jgi:hypothetical protein
VTAIEFVNAMRPLPMKRRPTGSGIIGTIRSLPPALQVLAVMSAKRLTGADPTDGAAECSVNGRCSQGGRL